MTEAYIGPHYALDMKIIEQGKRITELEATLAAANIRLDIRHERVMELEVKLETFKINERETLEDVEESCKQMWKKERKRAEKAETEQGLLRAALTRLEEQLEWMSNDSNEVMAQRDAALDVCRDWLNLDTIYDLHEPDGSPDLSIADLIGQTRTVLGLNPPPGRPIINGEGQSGAER